MMNSEEATILLQRPFEQTKNQIRDRYTANKIIDRLRGPLLGPKTPTFYLFNPS